MVIDFQLATAHDEAPVLAMMADFYAIDGYPFNREKAGHIFQTLVANEGLGRLWLIAEDTNAIGYVFLAFSFSFEYGGRNAFIDELYLQPPHRHKGIGKTILAFVEKQAIALGVQTLHLEVERHNDAGLKLYGGRGFKDSGRYLFVKRLGGEKSEDGSPQSEDGRKTV
ncbi:GNAT family N-acetyltransferase [Paracnuella aquatica]|uniref:GNAT family N-acetyltransferase n=1 Tax=Paracnuella aquatica TaxID=2268757 RepID=UPI000F506636|nr:GNAT family N-acetyltransferase [Paracnuella aquatica]RPD44443.1 GNAT family N-acetyltransferase [Paracnuella aquatica]